MGTTVEQILNELERPENEGEIKHLVHLKNLHNLDELKQIRGFGGFVSRMVLSFTRKHMEAFMALSECKTAADITAFKQTKHFQKIKSAQVGGDMDLKDLAELSDLEELKELKKL
ncbi:MAG: hypothetical protein FWB88_11250 [Defluviitaleaceae bacterium]|nr:hypothetical protein [Defluviitaleaceae bacterium]MCL2240210.1 hypothetical protein [Defluviitaleaceae bacterium]